MFESVKIYKSFYGKWVGLEGQRIGRVGAVVGLYRGWGYKDTSENGIALRVASYVLRVEVKKVGSPAVGSKKRLLGDKVELSF